MAVLLLLPQRKMRLNGDSLVFTFEKGENPVTIKLEFAVYNNGCSKYLEIG